MKAFTIKSLGKSIGKRTILDDVNLTLKPNTIYGLIGNNGAGKTTFFRSILGLTAYSGTISIDGISTREYPFREYLKKIGMVMPFPEAYDKFYIGDIIQEHLHYMDAEDESNIWKTISDMGLEVLPETRVSELSLGMKQKLNIAIALSHSPELLLLDEPFNGLDRDGIKTLKEIIQGYKCENKIVIVSSHSSYELDRLIDEVIVLRTGKIIAQERLSDFGKKGFANIDEYFEALERQVAL